MMRTTGFIASAVAAAISVAAFAQDVTIPDEDAVKTIWTGTAGTLTSTSVARGSSDAVCDSARNRAETGGYIADNSTAVSLEAGSSKAEGSDVDVQGILFGHINDSYWWHITDIGDKSIVIPLPVIVHSKTTGWHIFKSTRLEHGEQFEGFRIADNGEYTDKIVEAGADGTEIRPFDISITKNVFALMFNSLLLVVLILSCARWYRKHDAVNEAPTGIAGLLEPVIMMINDDVIKDAVGKDYRKYSPYLLTAFFFILINNLMGIVPFFPGGANVTGNIAITLVLALCTFIAVNVFGNRHYWKDILWPDVPWWLKVPIPIMPIIEIFGIFTKPFSLMVRLFANIMAGHALILSLVCIVFVTAKLGPVMNGSMTVVAMLFGVFMDCLELLVAFIQAYIFTMLSAVFIGLAHQEPEAE
ncbi:MAG: F0F1 ATP synthase subunit A [Clostridium sp.]|nr:F0F1 ATP synthase subunit A [Bacteroides sp.]MCM1198918.1 F0F1 ATP synthase subunit A [Clostridium sp.]